MLQGVKSIIGIADTDTATETVLTKGAVKHSDAKDVGSGIKVATFVDRAGYIFGIIENPSVK